ncbi:hypothetical protein N7455_005738 [Penicillium solitum]|uniref:Uncharacterized protein n=1 Tax=Penicillium solitum TaxID=60172 RepID=A0A1V6QU69_9EURO|nr:uncharacterized protein PENSOL_c040G10285 [Penicillium solitum]KAJ5870797.1 hypothetical protein N7455_005738 [Penicillium solitum]OQD92567.1 hypothetical protein PENSOL_c040G10285 [Penicillium solitum]
MGQKGPPFISNPSSFRFVAGQSGNNSDKNRQNNGTESPEDDIDKDLDELSEEEWFQTGVDFVLSLERPCLSHISSAHPTGHAVSMQGTLLQLAPPTLDSDSRWQVSAEVFQRLFEMADRLDLDGYITPVQAWNRIRDHENFPRLTRERLKTLENAMRPNIKCRGFAAIMEEAIFEILLNKALGP